LWFCNPHVNPINLQKFIKLLHEMQSFFNKFDYLEIRKISPHKSCYRGKFRDIIFVVFIGLGPWVTNSESKNVNREISPWQNWMSDVVAANLVMKTKPERNLKMMFPSKSWLRGFLSLSLSCTHLSNCQLCTENNKLSFHFSMKSLSKNYSLESMLKKHKYELTITIYVSIFKVRF